MKLSEVGGDPTGSNRRLSQVDAPPTEGPPRDPQLSGLSGFWNNLQQFASELTQFGRQAGPGTLAELPDVARSLLPTRGGAEAGGRVLGALGEGAADIGESLLPTRGGAEAGGRVLRKVGDVATFATGGGGGPTVPRPGMRSAPTPGTPQQTLQDFQRLRMTPSAPAISQGRVAMPAARGIGRALPFSPVESGLARTRQQAEQAGVDIAEQHGTGAAEVPEQAGNIARNALNRFAQNKTQAATDFNEYDRLMHGAPATPVTGTLKYLNDLRGRFPNAPELQGLFTNPKFSTMRRALEPRTEVTPAETSSILDPSGRPIVTRPEVRTQTGGTLTTPELKELRTQIGYLIEHPEFGPENIPKAQLRGLYYALTADMRAAAARQSPAAMQALTRANTNYGIRMRVMERLEPLLKPGSAEGTFGKLNTAAQSTGSADAQLLKTAKDIMQPDEWSDIGSAMIRKLGFPQGVERADTLGPDFSLSAYARNWKRMSARAKELFFGDDAPGSTRNGLETLFRVANNKALMPRGLRGTVEQVGVGATAASVAIERALSAMASGRFPTGEIAAATAAGGGVYALSKAMMSPRFAQWLYGVGRQQLAGTESIPAAQETLRTAMAAAEEDRRREAERADLGSQAYQANRRGDIPQVQQLGDQRRRLGIRTLDPSELRQ
jgi:hypothetical protein